MHLLPSARSERHRVSDERETFMLDTHLFDRVVDGRIECAALIRRKLLVTGVQAAELRAIPDTREERRAELLQIFEEIAPELCLASSMCWDVNGAGFEQAEWNDGTGRFDRMLIRLKEIDGKHHRQNLNQIRDVVIAETAIKLGTTLVSDDAKLRQVVLEFGGRARPSAYLS